MKSCYKSRITRSKGAGYSALFTVITEESSNTEVTQPFATNETRTQISEQCATKATSNNLQVSDVQPHESSLPINLKPPTLVGELLKRPASRDCTLTFDHVQS
ncbi:uncharacterized protein [Physcomitrium patens]|uniref:uncharacterized protein n=1 Tax=Physcomitrium patens TaxID=3218 RepID=UPI003CCCD7A9